MKKQIALYSFELTIINKYFLDLAEDMEPLRDSPEMREFKTQAIAARLDYIAERLKKLADNMTLVAINLRLGEPL